MAVRAETTRGHAAPLRINGLVLARWGVVAAGLLLWEAAARTVVPAYFLPPISQIVPRVLALLGDPDVVSDLGLTLKEVGLAFVLAVTGGLLLGLVAGSTRFLRDAFEPILLGVLSVPKILFLPLFLLSLGIGLAEKVVYGAFRGLVTLAVTVNAGFRGLDARWVMMGRIYGATTPQIWRTIVLPSMTPLLYTGARMVIGFAFLGVILAEMAISAGGIGHRLSLAADRGDVRTLFALIFVITAIALAIDSLLAWHYRRAFRWKQAARGR
jgi:NitT/TauT family transport system permease protein